MNFAVSADHNENEKLNKYLDLDREVRKKTMEHDGDSNGIYS